MPQSMKPNCVDGENCKTETHFSLCLAPT